MAARRQQLQSRSMSTLILTIFFATSLFILSLAQYQHLGNDIQLVRNAGHIQTLGHNPSSTNPQQFINQQQQQQQQFLQQQQQQQHNFRTQQLSNPFSGLGNLGNLGSGSNPFAGLGNLGNGASTPLDLGSLTGGLPNGNTGGSSLSDLIGILEGTGNSTGGIPLVDRVHDAVPKAGNSTAVEGGYAGTRDAASYSTGSGTNGAAPTTTDAKNKLISTSPTTTGTVTNPTTPTPIPTNPNTNPTAPSEETPTNPTNPTTPTTPGTGTGGDGIGTNVPLNPGSNGNGGVINKPRPRSSAGSLSLSFTVLVIIIGSLQVFG